jgi:hypothetical protein
MAVSDEIRLHTLYLAKSIQMKTLRHSTPSHPKCTKNLRDPDIEDPSILFCSVIFMTYLSLQVRFEGDP